MASLIVIALVMVVTGVLVGAFIAVSITIRLGKGVRSLIWRRTDRPDAGLSPADWLGPSALARRAGALATAGAASALGDRSPPPDLREAS